LRLSPSRLWGGAIVLALWVWSWQLVLALGIGAVVLVSVYLGQQQQMPQVNWRWLMGANRSLTIAVASGSVAAFSAYVTTGIWMGTEQHGLAIGIILQGFGTLTVLGWMTWQTVNQQTVNQQTVNRQAMTAPFEGAFDQALADLSADDPLKRLIAVRQMTRWVQEADTLPMTPAHITDCFRLMLDRETEAIVCGALMEGLQVLGQGRQLESSAAG
jgi:hypothetical protein